MYADLAMDNQILRDLFTKKAGPCHKRQLTEELVCEQRHFGEQGLQDDLITEVSVYYRSKMDDTAIIEALQELAFKHPSYGSESSLHT